MVEKQVILETIKKMLSSGLNDKVVISTLKDAGLSEQEAESYLQEAKGISVEEEVPEEHEKIAERTAQKIKNHLDEQKSLGDLAQTTTHAALQEHGERLEAIKKKIEGIPQAPANFNLLSKKLSSIEAQLKEVKAQSLATQELLKKVLQALKKK